MLTQEELLAFTGPPNESVQLSRTAVRRIFEENINYSPMEMDYKVGEVKQSRVVIESHPKLSLDLL